MLAAVLGLPLALAVGAAAIALTVGADDDEAVPPAPSASTPLTLAAVPGAAAASPECAALVAALPAELPSGATQLDRRPLAEPAPPGAAAWGVDDPVVLRCGLDRPAELTRTAELLEINGVRWLRLSDPVTASSTWVAADRPVYVALTLPDTTGTGPLQDVSSAIAASLPAQLVRPAG